MEHKTLELDGVTYNITTPYPNDVELWKTIEEHPQYQVSNWGRFRHRQSKRTLVKWPLQRSGYLITRFYSSERYAQGCASYHRTVRTTPIIAKYWIGPRPPGYQVDHLKGKTDELAPNLEYVTQSENIRRSYAKGNRRHRYVEKHVTDYQHLIIKRRFKAGETQVQLGKALGLDNSAISRIIRGKMSPCGIVDPRKVNDLEYWPNPSLIKVPHLRKQAEEQLAVIEREMGLTSVTSAA